MKINHDIIHRSSLSKTINWWRLQKSLPGYAINRLQWHWYPRLFHVRRYPIHIDMELSSRCQLKCPMCFRQHRQVEKQGDMDFDLFRKIIDEISGRVYSIKFTGRGEPLMNRQVTRYFDYLAGKKFGEVAMITNGLRMTEDIMISLIDNGFDFISFSIDGLADKYQTIRRPGKYEDIKAAVAKLHRLRTSRGHRKPLIRAQSVMLDPQEQEEYLRQWAPITDDIYFLHFKDYSVQADNRQMERYTCPLPFQRMMIHYDGIVPMCINDEYEHTVMGDLNTQTVREVWVGQAWRRARRLHREGLRTDEYENCRLCALTREGHGN